MSFCSILNEDGSKIIAQTETETELLLLPSTLERSWLKRFPELSIFFLQLNNLRYVELLQTINEVLFENLDKRILRFLHECFAPLNNRTEFQIYFCNYVY